MARIPVALRMLLLLFLSTAPVFSSPVAAPDSGGVAGCDSEEYTAALNLDVPQAIAADIFCPDSPNKPKRRGFDLSPRAPEDILILDPFQDAPAPSLLKRLFGSSSTKAAPGKRLSEAEERREVENRVMERLGQRDFENNWRRQKGYAGF